MGSGDPDPDHRVALELTRAARATWCTATLVLFSICLDVPRVWAEPPFVTVGVGAGVIDVALPDPDSPSEDFGARPRLRFDIGVRPRPWLEVGGELGLAFLGDADSLRAFLAQQGLEDEAAYTLVDWGVGARLVWARSKRAALFVRGSAGMGWLRLAAPEDYGQRETDATWSFGGGLEVVPFTRSLVRIEARALGQAADDGTHHHATFEAVLLYAPGRERFADPN